MSKNINDGREFYFVVKGEFNEDGTINVWVDADAGDAILNRDNMWDPEENFMTTAPEDDYETIYVEIDKRLKGNQ